MAKRKVKIASNGFECGYEEVKLSSGITIKILPFPARLFEKFQERALEKFPDPVPDKKEIEAFGGPETVDNIDDPEYIMAMSEADGKRSRFISEKVLEFLLEFCVELELAEYEEIIKRLEKYTGAYPDDPIERKIQFLSDYAIKKKSEYELLISSSLTQTFIDDPEVAKRLSSFQNQLAQTTADESDASGADAKERVGVG